MTKITKNSSEFVSIFEKYAPVIDEHATPKLNTYRQNAIETFRQIGFPTQKVEDYKYTNLDKVFDFDYGLDFKNTLSNPKETAHCKAPLKEAYTISTCNGYLIENNEVALLQKQGVIVCSLQEASQNHQELFEKYYNKQAKESKHGIVALNTAFAQAGIFIYVPKNLELDKPIQLINELYSQSDLMVNPRNLLIIAPNAKVQLFEYTYAENCHTLLSNIVTELYAETNSDVAYYTLQNQCEKSSILHSFFISQKRDSRVISNTLSLHAKLIRNNITVSLEEENCENSTYGLYIADKTEHIDNFSTIKHIAPNCKSWELFKGILDEQAKTAFCGQIHVYKDAQKTEAYQTNNNLLLSNNAKANTKPQLIIEADDVSCSHGATVGQLDEDAIFYLRARGINRQEAYRIMMVAFMNEVTSKITIEPLQTFIEEKVALKMQGEKIYCGICADKK